MPDTGAPWNLPYPAASDLVKDGAAAIQSLAEDVADGLDNASLVKQVKQVVTTTNFTTSSATAVDLTGVTVTVVPSDATNRIVMFFTCNHSNGASGNENYFQFRRDTTDLFEENAFEVSSNGGKVAAAMVFDEVASSTASRTYSIRTRTQGNTMTVSNSTLIVMEYAV